MRNSSLSRAGVLYILLAVAASGVQSQVHAQSPTAIYISHSHVPERSPNGTVVGVLAAIDPDPGDTFSFELVGGAGGEHNENFSVSGDELRVHSPTGRAPDLDYEELGADISVRVQATDSSGNTFQQAIAILMIDDRSEDFDGDGLAESVEEDLYQTSDLKFDSDGDGMGDGWEVDGGSLPSDPDDFASVGVVAFGLNEKGQLDVPLADYATIGLGDSYALGLTTEGRAIAWGGKITGLEVPFVPDSLSAGVLAISPTGDPVAVETDGRVVTWNFASRAGSERRHPALVDVVSVVANGNSTIALRADGTILQSDLDLSGPTVVPLGKTAVAIAAGRSHFVALTADGRVTYWSKGFAGVGADVVPALDRVTEIVAGADEGIAISVSGLARSWDLSPGGFQILPVEVRNPIDVSVDYFSGGIAEDGIAHFWGQRVEGSVFSIPPAFRDLTQLAVRGQPSSLADLDKKRCVAIRAPAGSQPRMTSSGALLGFKAGHPLTHRVELNVPVTRFRALGVPPGLGFSETSGLLFGQLPVQGEWVVGIYAETAAGYVHQNLFIQVVTGAPPISISLSSLTVVENSASGTTVGFLSAADPDQQSGHQFDLPKVGPFYESFAVVGNELVVVSAPDFEEHGPSIPLAVRATDSDGNRFDAVLDLTLIDDRSEDADRDGLTEAEEEDSFGISDTEYDSDGDFISDGWEVDGGSSPTDPGSIPDRAIFGWGSNHYGQIEVPPGDFVSLDAGYRHSLGLRTDGTVVAWGNPEDGRTEVPAGLADVVDISAGHSHNLALTDAGAVVAWGSNTNGESTVPAGLDDVISISAGGWHSLALRTDGTVVAWGINSSGQSDVPSDLGTVVDVSAGHGYSWAVLSDGSVRSWGGSAGTVPGDLEAVHLESGTRGAVAVTSDGGAVANQSLHRWLHSAESPDRPGDFRDLASASVSNLGLYGLRKDGAVTAWGRTSFPRRPAVESLPAASRSGIQFLTAGDEFLLAIRGGDVPAISSRPDLPEAWVGQAFHHQVVANVPADRFTVIGLPPGLTISESDGVIAGTPASPGLFFSRITAETDSGFLHQILQFTISDENSPRDLAISNAQVLENSPVGTVVGDLSATDPLGSGLQFILLNSGLYDPALLELNGSSLVVARAPDYEFDPAQLLVRIEIRTGTGDVRRETLKIEILDDDSEDADRDGLVQRDEGFAGTSDLVYDSDGDGYADGVEVSGGSDPLDPTRFPSTGIIAWENGIGSDEAIANPPVAEFVQIDGGFSHFVGLTQDGRVLAWGVDENELEGPSSNLGVPVGLRDVVQVSAGGNEDEGLINMVLLRDGSVEVWKSEGELVSGHVTLSGVDDAIAVSAGVTNGYILMRDGTVSEWFPGGSISRAGEDCWEGIVAIAAGGDDGETSLAVRSDGMIVGIEDGECDGEGELVGTVDDGIGVAVRELTSLAITRGGFVSAISAPRSYSPIRSVPASVEDVVELDVGGLSYGEGFSWALARTRSGEMFQWGDFTPSFPPTAQGGVRAVATTDIAGSCCYRQASGFPEIISASQAVGFRGGAFAHQILLSNATAVSYSAVGLPRGLSLDPHTGLISGVVDDSQNRTVRVMVDTASGLRLTQMLFIRLSSPLLYEPRVDYSSNAVYVSRNRNNGSEVSHFRITVIEGVEIRAGSRLLKQGDFITIAEAAAGLDFSELQNSTHREIRLVSAFSTEFGQSGHLEAVLNLAPEGDPQLGEDRYYVREDAGELWVQVLGGGSVMELTLEAADGTAELDVDYAADGGGGSHSVMLPAGGSTSLRYFILDGSEEELDQSFTLTLKDEGGAVLDTATVTIVDDDADGHSVPAVASGAGSSGSGSVLVELSPSGIGGRWRLSSEFDWREGGVQHTGLSPGTYRVQVLEVAGYAAPNEFEVVVTDGVQSLVTVDYQPLPAAGVGSLRVFCPGGAWRRRGQEEWLASGAIEEGLRAGDYVVEFQFIANHRAPESQLVSVTAGAEVEVIESYAPLGAFGGSPDELVLQPAGIFDDVGGAPSEHGFAGQVVSSAGFSSGTAVQPNLVLTVAHAIFNFDESTYYDEVDWHFRHDRGFNETPPQQARGSFIFGEGYAAQYAQVKAAGNAARSSNITAYDLDVAALWFGNPVARGGYSGFLVRPDLGGSERGFLGGYPMEVVPPADRGRYHASVIAARDFERILRFDGTETNVFATRQVRAYPGTSGGALALLHDDGRHYPAGIFVGEWQNPLTLERQTLVRSIDHEVAYLIRSAQEAAGVVGAGGSGNGIALFPQITSPVVLVIPLDEPFGHQISAFGAPIDYSATGLPPGLSIDGSTGLISGTPTQPGYFLVTLTASNLNGSDKHALSLRVEPPLLFAPEVQLGTGGVGVVVQPDPRSGPEVTHFRLIDAQGVSLDVGGSPLSPGDFINLVDGAAGLGFTLDPQAQAREVSFVAAYGTSPAESGALEGRLSFDPAEDAHFGLASYYVREDSGELWVEVRGGQTGGNYTVRTTDGTALIGSDYSHEGGGASQSFVLAAGGSARVRLFILDGSEDEPDKGFTMTLTETGGGVIDAATVLIVDDDGIPHSTPAVAPGSAAAPSGSIRVEPQPDSLGSTGWRLSGEATWRGGGTAVTGLRPGRYRLEFREVPGKVPLAPLSIDVGLAEERLVAFYEDEVGIASGELRVVGSGVSGALWRRLGQEAWRDSGEFETLPVGEYIIEYSYVSEYRRPENRMFEVVAGQRTEIADSYVYLGPFKAGASEPTLRTEAELVGPGGLPYEFCGSVSSGGGEGSGVAVDDQVVLTTARGVFNYESGSFYRNADWKFQHYASESERAPQRARGALIFGEGYAAGYAQLQAAGNTSTSANASAFDLDVAVLWFADPVGRGGRSGFLVRPFLATEAAFLAGYPTSGVPADELGKLSATDVTNVRLVQLGRFDGGLTTAFVTTDLRGRPGMEGGALFAAHADGNFYPAAVFVGERREPVSLERQSVFRAIDHEVAFLIRRAQEAAEGGDDGTGAGVRLYAAQTVDYLPTPITGVTLDANLGAFVDGRWRVAKDGLASSWFTSGIPVSIHFDAEVVEVEFRDVSGFDVVGSTDALGVPGSIDPPDEVVVTGVYSPTEGSYPAWAAEYGLVGGELGDDDGDGLENLLEFAFGLDPLRASAVDSPGGGLPELGMGDDGAVRVLSIVYLRRTGAGLNYAAQVSEDLGDLAGWEPAAGSEIIVPLGAGWERATIEIPIEGEHRLFARVKVSRN